MIAHLERGARGANPRFVVTSLHDDAVKLYESPYCTPDQAENRIKEVQLDLFARRANCHAWRANQLRLLLASNHPLKAVFLSAAQRLGP